MFLFCDIGTKNFCYLICDEKKEILNFEILNFEKDTINSVLRFLQSLSTYSFTSVFIEAQIFKNAKCLRIETVIATYLTLNKIPFKLVQASKKYRLLGFSSHDYRLRKKFVVEKGAEMLKDAVTSDDIRQRIKDLKKKDDVYDCILMMFTEL